MWGRWLLTAQAWVSRLAGHWRLTGRGMSLGGCYKLGKTEGAAEQTVSGRGRWCKPARGLYKASEVARGME